MKTGHLKLRTKVIEGSKWTKPNEMIVEVTGKVDKIDNFVPVKSTFNGNHSSYYEHLRDFKKFKLIK